MIRIVSVAPRSPAGRAGLRPGMELVSVNGETFRDFIDLEYFESMAELTLLARENGVERQYVIRKPAYTPLGLEMEDAVYPPERQCANHCIFCFVDQMPCHMRPSLYGKDDDWRYSLLFGNYVTLTNLGDREFQRIIDRGVSPLNISVHATDGAVRAAMMGNPRAASIMEQLRRLQAGGIQFHCQVVLCPGHNDGPVLQRTLEDLWSLYPAAQSVAVVPVGLTRFREGLEGLRLPTAEEMGRTIDAIEAFSRRCLEEKQEHFCYASDECYQLAGRPWPRYEDGCHTPQLSNGVGLFHDLLTEYEAALEELPPRLDGPRRVLLATGVSAASTMEELTRGLMDRYPELSCQVVTVRNRFFGDTITVAGLLTARDILHSIQGLQADVLLIPQVCLRDGEDVFLDDITLEAFAEAVGFPVLPVENDGAALLMALTGLADCEGMER